MLRRSKTEIEKKVIFEEGRYIFSEEKLKENEECIWTRKICFFAEENVNTRGKGRKYLEKENMFFCEGEE